VNSAGNGKEGMTVHEHEQPALVLLDQKLPDIEGIEVCRKILEMDPRTKVILVTAYATVRCAVDAIKAGAFNYLSKPFELDELLIIMGLALKNVQMEGKIRVQDYKRTKESEEKQLIGSSGEMQRVREQIRIAATTDSNVLITGETGVGKNVVARAIHDLQTGRENFLMVNCSAIPENLMEAEYFGHEKGVFTGADTRREGIFELADGGTLVLDEIGEIPTRLQSKLLTILEDKCVRRIGGGRNIPVDVRIMATTNQDLDRAIRERRFRQDLYYRLAVVTIQVPPLRERPSDIPEIAEYFARLFCRKLVSIPDHDMRKMIDYPWPGNIRELRNVIERASLLLKGNILRPAGLLIDSDDGSAWADHKPADTTEIIPLQELKRQQILTALKACAGNKSRTARTLGISLSTLKRTLAEINMNGH
ncbi:MAG: sigma-54-dependent transcriptional regulator, partial [Deltaproteobacteria bacterium]